VKLADLLTLSRLGLAPLAALAYLYLPVDGFACFWVAAILCLVAEATDWFDGRVARARGQVTDFGKLGDPFCDVFFRIGVFLALVLPAGGTGFDVDPDRVPFLAPPRYADAEGGLGYGTVPWWPVLIMTLREIVAGALRSMAATRGLVLAARMSGKIKAFMQGATLLIVLLLPVVGSPPVATLWIAWALTWLCAGLSLYSILQYIVINRRTLAALLEAR